MTTEQPQDKKISVCDVVILQGGCPSCPQYLTCKNPDRRVITPLTQDITGQCENCKNIGKRSCMFHGYPESAIPKYCHFKIGNCAEEAQKNISPLTQDTTGHFVSGQSTSPPVCSGGGFAEHWTAKEARKKRDGEIRQDATEKVLDKIWTNIQTDKIFSSEVRKYLLKIIESLRKKDGE